MKNLFHHQHTISRVVPKQWRDRFDRIPTRYKRLCCIVWVGWKFVALFLVYYFSSVRQEQTTHRHHRRRRGTPQQSTPSILLLVTTPSSSTETMRAAVERIVSTLDDFLVQVRWIVADDVSHNDNDDHDPLAYFWPEATPLFGGSLYRQERFVIKDELSSNPIMFDLMMALYQEDVLMSNDMVHEYLATSRKLLLLEDIKVDYLPLISLDDTAGITPSVMDHPTLGLAQIYNDSDTTNPTWGWMATPLQLFLLYRQGQFLLPPFDDDAARTNDDLFWRRGPHDVSFILPIVHDDVRSAVQQDDEANAAKE